MAIVTGANSRIGRATAVALAGAGYDLGITWHREQERALEAAAEIERRDVRRETRRIDLHDGERAVAVVEELGGGVEVLVNNTGYGTSKPFLKPSAEEWQGMIDVDLTAPWPPIGPPM